MKREIDDLIVHISCQLLVVESACDIIYLYDCIEGIMEVDGLVRNLYELNDLLSE